MPEEDDDDADEEDDADDEDDEDEEDVVVPVVADDELVSPELVVSAPPSPPAPPAPPAALPEPVVVSRFPPTPLWVVDSPELAQPVLKTPTIKDKVDPRTSLWRIL